MSKEVILTQHMVIVNVLKRFFYSKCIEEILLVPDPYSHEISRSFSFAFHFSKRLVIILWQEGYQTIVVIAREILEDFLMTGSHSLETANFCHHLAVAIHALWIPWTYMRFTTFQLHLVVDPLYSLLTFVWHCEHHNTTCLVCLAVQYLLVSVRKRFSIKENWSKSYSHQ